MKVAVTGASGFVGRHVVAALARRGVEVVASSRTRPVNLPVGIAHVAIDLADAGDVFDRLSRPDAIIHLAWAGLPNYRSLHHFETELPLQYAFLRRLIDGGADRLIIAGTCYEYGMQDGELDETVDARPGNPYAYAKDALRQQLEFLRAARPFDLTWLRLFYMYGEGQAATSLYPQIMAAIARGDARFPMSGGEQLRDFLPVVDVAAAIVDVALGVQGAGILNVCSGKPTSVRGFVERVVRENGSSITLDRGIFPYPDYEPMAFWGSSSRLERLLGEIDG
ncbi:NAD(P)-dependent oxidoreductase [Polymorphobacter sp. PAMC 29334]|uniref:NAD-dependent epimerase/dehydratase family protein n=1 Tax=Polymorphobacter sp. PAMC 29334 TaxID=2862331 RepID=UPI001C66A071|nr:NAD(P)-dependent oxidoreductase [Polymorphobacter sp. PAMC 29334]QYE35951.1 NAD(P)-dependent oxidoreductase [Polymorphobacter sp. PAMC 29334]